MRWARPSKHRFTCLGFPTLTGNSPARLIRARGRHSADIEMVVRFRKETLDYELVLESGAAALYPFLLQIKTAFSGQTFSPKDLCMATGISRATAHRHINRLHPADALNKRRSGEYELTSLVRQWLWTVGDT